MPNTSVSIDTQRVASVIRQIGSIAAIVVGALSTSGILNLLPTGASAALIAVGGALQVVEHYQSNQSSTTTSSSTPVPTGAPALPASPQVPPS